MWLHPQRLARFELAQRAGNEALEAEVGGHRLLVSPQDDRVGRTLYVLRQYEPIETELVRQTLRPGDTFVDVGAHVGYYALFAARQVGPTGRVHALEAHPDNHALLEQNIALNAYPNIEAFHVAASDEAGVAELYVSTSGNLGGHALVPSGGKSEDSPRVEVRTVRLDDHFAEHGLRPDVMKLDVEGAEARVVRGMDETLATGRPHTLFFEFSPGPLRAAGDEPLALLETLAQHGYELGRVPKTEGRKVRAASPAHILRTVEDRYAFQDLVAWRS